MEKNGEKILTVLKDIKLVSFHKRGPG
jgi:hypothetical protein